MVLSRQKNFSLMFPFHRFTFAWKKVSFLSGKMHGRKVLEVNDKEFLKGKPLLKNKRNARTTLIKKSLYITSLTSSYFISLKTTLILI